MLVPLRACLSGSQKGFGEGTEWGNSTCQFHQVIFRTFTGRTHLGRPQKGNLGRQRTQDHLLNLRSETLRIVGVYPSPSLALQVEADGTAGKMNSVALFGGGAR